VETCGRIAYRVDRSFVRNRGDCQELCLRFDGFYVRTPRKSLISNARFDNNYVSHHNKDDVGSEFAVDVAGQSLPGKVEDTGDSDSSKKFSVGQVALTKGEIYNVTVRLTKPVGRGMNLSYVELVKKKD